MNQQDFNSITGELLADTWGEKNYPPAVMSRLWRMVKDISAGDFRQALDSLSFTVTRAPTLGQIRGALMPAIRKALEMRRESALLKLGTSCHYCAGTGWVNAIPFDNPLIDYAFICSKCEAPRVRGISPQDGKKQATYWSDDFEHKYFVRRFTLADDMKATEMERAARADLYARRRGGLGKLEVTQTVAQIAERASNHQPIDFGVSESDEETNDANA